MAQSAAPMAGLRGNSPAALDGSSLASHSNPNRLNIGNRSRFGSTRTSFAPVRAQAEQTNEALSRRAVLGLVAAGIASGSFAQAVLAEARSIKIGPPPPPSGGLPGTLNSDQARDFELPYTKDRFYLQPLSPAEAAVRAKESAKEILGVKSYIDKKAWPYVQNDLRSKAEYLRFDLNTIISAKPKGAEKQKFKELYGKLFQTIDKLDHAAKIKSSKEAEKYYDETVSALNDVITNIG